MRAEDILLNYLPSTGHRLLNIKISDRGNILCADELNELGTCPTCQTRSHAAPVSLTMAILAVLVAVVSLMMGHRAHTEEVILQAKASDHVGLFQAENIRGHEDKLFANLTAIATSSQPEAGKKVREEYLQESER